MKRLTIAVQSIQAEGVVSAADIVFVARTLKFTGGFAVHRVIFGYP